jgi:hypothetical protein
MKATLTFGVALLTALGLLVATPAARAADDEVPSIKKYPDEKKEKEYKQFASDLGSAVVKAARTKPVDLELEDYKVTEPKKDHKELKIVMNWKGALTKKKFQSTIIVKIDASDKAKMEVTNIDYSDDNKISTKPNAAEIQKLIKQINRD